MHISSPFIKSSIYLAFGLVSALALSVVPVASTAQTPPLTVRVDARSGAPRLTVNGKPRRARFFYGQPASGVLLATTEGKRYTFEFVADRSVDHAATMHWRFGQIPGNIYISGLQIMDVSTGDQVIAGDLNTIRPNLGPDWQSWPIGAQNNVGEYNMESGTGEANAPALHVSIRKPPNGNWPDFHIYHEANLTFVQGHRYRVSAWIRSDKERQITLAFYKPGTTYQFLGGPPGHYESQVKLAAGAGVDFVSFSIPMPWPAPGEAEDWTGVDSVLDTTLAANPKALMLPRIPIYAPQWWLQTHQDEKMAWENGDHGGIASVASAVFATESSARLARLIDHIEAKYGNHIAGYHPNGQNTGEWFYFDSWEHPLNGYAPCDATAFQKWVSRKYATVERLNAAWHTDFPAYDAITVPSAAARHAAPAGILRDPLREQSILDFSQFQQDSMADLVCSLAKVVRSHTGGRKLSTFFFGYVYEFGAIPTGPACAGHYALRKLLNSPDIDVICSPISYFDRGPGESAPCMTAAESVALAGKMWLNEDDTRTHLTHEDTFPGAQHVVKNVYETNGELVRNVAQEAARNFATWWMDLPASGWFDDPAMWAEMKRMNAMDSELLALQLPFRPQIADVIDPEAMTMVAEGGAEVSRPLVYESRAEFGRTGAPYGQYLLDDVAAGRVHAKLYVFNSPWSLTEAQRANILKSTRQATKLWCYAPGMFDSGRLNPGAMQQLTGFKILPAKSATALAEPTSAGKKLGLQKKIGINRAVTPLFMAADARPEEVLAAYPNGEAAVAVRKTASGVSIFCGAPALSSELLRAAAKMAGVSLYTGSDCIVYGNGPYLSIHGIADGQLKINTHTSGAVADGLTGALIGMGPEVSIPVKKGQTRILRLSGWKRQHQSPLLKAHKLIIQ